MDIVCVWVSITIYVWLTWLSSKFTVDSCVWFVCNEENTLPFIWLVGIQHFNSYGFFLNLFTYYIVVNKIRNMT